jgi:hypothetical protein
VSTHHDQHVESITVAAHAVSSATEPYTESTYQTWSSHSHPTDATA